MQKPLELTFRNMPQSRAMTELVYEKVEKLEKLCDYITSCRVVVDKPQAHQQSGNPFQVLIQVRIPPGHDLVVRREPNENAMHDNLGTVLRDAFDALQRQVKGIVQRQHDRVKVHPQQEASAVVLELEDGEGYGFLETVDGRRIYFHRNSVLHNDFERLEIGTGVRFMEEMGESGPQATTVQIVDKPGARISDSEA